VLRKQHDPVLVLQNYIVDFEKALLPPSGIIDFCCQVIIIACAHLVAT